MRWFYGKSRNWNIFFPPCRSSALTLMILMKRVNENQIHARATNVGQILMKDSTFQLDRRETFDVELLCAKRSYECNGFRCAISGFRKVWCQWHRVTTETHTFAHSTKWSELQWTFRERDRERENERAKKHVLLLRPSLTWTFHSHFVFRNFATAKKRHKMNLVVVVVHFQTYFANIC